MRKCRSCRTGGQSGVKSSRKIFRMARKDRGPRGRCMKPLVRLILPVSCQGIVLMVVAALMEYNVQKTSQLRVGYSRKWSVLRFLTSLPAYYLTIVSDRRPSNPRLRTVSRPW
jgi:hypothetical protein